MSEDIAAKIKFLDRVLSLQGEAMERIIEDAQMIASSENNTIELPVKSPEKRKASEDEEEVAEKLFKNDELTAETVKKPKLLEEVDQEQSKADELNVRSPEKSVSPEEIADEQPQSDEPIVDTLKNLNSPEKVAEKQPEHIESIVKTPEKTDVSEKQLKNDADLTTTTPERKSIIEIRISNEVNAVEPLCESPTSTRVERKIIDLEKRHGGILNQSPNPPEVKLEFDDVPIKTEPRATSESPKSMEISSSSQFVAQVANEQIKQEQTNESDTLPTIKAEADASTIEEGKTLEGGIAENKLQNEVTKREINDSVKMEVDSSVKIEENGVLKEEEQFPIIQLTEAEQVIDQQFRVSCKAFLQHVPCFKLRTSIEGVYDDVKVPRCRECRRKDIIMHTGEGEVSSSSDVYCRFYEFRRLVYTAEGELCVSGFLNPYQDPKQEDINIWQPDKHTEPTAGYMDVQVCRFILLHVGDQFCYLWQQEVEALKINENPDRNIAWKKLVRDTREICDVCDTTLFNYHWTCKKCGFGVCIDCFKDRKEERVRQKFSTKSRRGRDEYHWLLCTNNAKHQLPELMLTQIITGNSLQVLGGLLHEVRTIWKIPQKCNCLKSHEKLPEGPGTEILDNVVTDMINESRLNQHTAASSLATRETLRHQRRMEKFHSLKVKFARSLDIDYVPGRMVTKETLDKDPITTAFDSYEHINFLRKGMAGYRRFLPPKVMTMCSSTMIAPNVRHEWLCDGKLLRLTDPLHPDNRILFQEVWKCGQPVMVSEVARSLNLDLWRPEAFCRDFGDKPNDLINCLNGNLVPNQPMRHFWEGFQCIKKRLLDASGNPMLLKLKDWPPGDDFAEILPTRYADLMKGLPLPEYTLRTGNLNIASCLPKMFVPPDLGPKMYNAYGSALHPDKGTTNLHLDISDAVNVMVYVGIPQDAESRAQLDAAQHAIAMGGCDFLTRLRCQSPNVMPGALWHIFAARDADKIRDLLNRVTLEKGFRLEPDHDPIHDQNWYLDDELRARLYCEYRVKAYPIVQCLGDAVFIPAGAPHQVQNLHNCIKVAEDFVSPENITHCYHLTHEFRHLSNSHTNHEDKLQIKNIIYHSVKDCCTILMRALDRRYDTELANLKRTRKLDMQSTLMI